MDKYNVGDTVYLNYPSDMDAFPSTVVYVHDARRYVVENVHGSLMVVWDDDLYDSRKSALQELVHDWEERVNQKTEQLNVIKQKLKAMP